MENALLSMASEFTGLPMDSLIGGPLNAAAKANAAMALTQTKFMLDTCFTKARIEETKEIPAKDATYDANGIETAPATMGMPAIAAHDAYIPIMIKMSLTRGIITPGAASYRDKDGKIVPATGARLQYMSTAFDLPMLTIVPLNSLAVSTVDIGFEMEVKSSFDESTSQKSEKAVHAEASFEAKCGWGPFSVTITGKASYDTKDSSTHDTHYQKSNSAKYTVGVHAAQLPLPAGVNIIIQAFANSISPIEMKPGLPVEQPAAK